jgi:hypothetical protein
VSKGAERVWPQPEPQEPSKHVYRLTVIEGGYAIRIEREGRGQVIRHDRLCLDGMNVINACTSMIESMIEGTVIRPIPRQPE